MDHVLMLADQFAEGCFIARPGQCHSVVRQAVVRGGRVEGGQHSSF